MIDTKFIKACLEVCDNENEIDYIFDLFGFGTNNKSYEIRCNYLKENGATYFDLPLGPEEQYKCLREMYISQSSKHRREADKVKKWVNNNL